MNREYRKTIWGGVVSALVIGAGSYGVGHLSNYEAVSMLQAMLPTTRFLCASVMTSTSTVLALILTLISLSNGTDKPLKGSHYDRVKLIAKFACTAFIAALVLLLFVNLPIEEAPDEIKVWLWMIYYAVLVYAALLGGLLVAIVLMLYQAATDMILIVHPETDSNLLISKDVSEEEKEREKEKVEDASGD